jgi:hypothetical protein
MSEEICNQCHAEGYKEGLNSLHNKSRKICWEDGYKKAIEDIKILINEIAKGLYHENVCDCDICYEQLEILRKLKLELRKYEKRDKKSCEANQKA